MKFRPPGRTVLLVGAVLACAAAAPLPLLAENTLGHPGYIVLVDAADTTAGFRWHDGPGPGERSLVWREGVLTMPADVACEPFGTASVAVPVTADLAGVGAGGELVFRNGRYEVTEPVHLGDGRVGVYLAAGELEIRDERIRYTRPPKSGAAPDSRAGFLLLAGMILLVAVSLRVARRRQARAPGP